MSQQLVWIRNDVNFSEDVALQQSELQCDVGLQQREVECDSLCLTHA